MPRPPRKEEPDAAGSRDAPSAPPEDTPRPGMPAPESILSEKQFTSRSGKTYRILRTNESDSTDEPERTEETDDAEEDAKGAAPRRCPPDP
jgi:hypothetical protein